MDLSITITHDPISVPAWHPPRRGKHGALAEFRGVVRDDEDGQRIGGLRYRAYAGMAEKEIERILQQLARTHPVHAACVIHRIGDIPVGETAIYVGIASAHRAEAFALLSGFMDRLKQDVPIWKTDTLPPATKD